MLWLPGYSDCGNQLYLVPAFFSGIRAAYPVLSADPRRCVEADNREEGHDLKPADEQLLICDQVSGKRATCWEGGTNGKEDDDEEEGLVRICVYHFVINHVRAGTLIQISASFKPFLWGDIYILFLYF